MPCPPRAAALLLLVVLSRPVTAYEGAEDKVLHVLFGLSTSLLASAVAAPLLAADQDPDDGVRDALLTAGVGLGAAVAAGLLKEALDLAGFGNPEWLDLAATVGGGLAASTAVFALSVWSGEPPRAGRVAGASACFGLVIAFPVGESLFSRLISRSSRRSRPSSGRSSVPPTPVRIPCPARWGCRCASG